MKKYFIAVLLLFFFVFSDAQQPIQGDPPKDAIIYSCAPCGCPDDGKYFSNMGNCPSCNMSLQPSIQGLERRAASIERPKAGIFLFNSADVMDVTGPISVFEHAGFNIFTFSKTSEPVRIGMNLELKPDFNFSNLPEVDILVFPGGGLAESNPGDKEVVQFIKSRYEATDVLFSVCSGAFFLGEAGLLDGQEATTFASMIPLLAENYPSVEALNDVKYTDNGKIVTSAGLSSGIDAAFHVVSKYYGIGRAQDIANHMEYPWKREHDYARSQLADNYLSGIRQLVNLFSTSFFYSQGDQNRWEMRFALTRQLPPEKVLELITKELKKRPDWKMQAKNASKISGIIHHPVLGEGKIFLAVKQVPDKGAVLSIRAERLGGKRAVKLKQK